MTHWRHKQLQAMLAVTVKMSRVRSNLCVVGGLESLLSFMFCSRFQQLPDFVLPCAVIILFSQKIHVVLLLCYSCGSCCFSTGSQIDGCAWLSHSFFFFFLFFSLLLPVLLLLPSLIPFLLLLRLTVIMMDVLRFPIQYSLLSSGSYIDLSSMVRAYNTQDMIWTDIGCMI